MGRAGAGTGCDPPDRSREEPTGTWSGDYRQNCRAPSRPATTHTGENLALKLRTRTGSAFSNTVSDHLEALTASIAQLPSSHRRDLLITCDGAGATKDLLTYVMALNTAPGRRVHYSVGFDLDARARTAIGKVPDTLWENVINADGTPRTLKDAGVVELTGLLRESLVNGTVIDQLKTWPRDMRVIVRRERPAPVLVDGTLRPCWSWNGRPNCGPPSKRRPAGTRGRKGSARFWRDLQT